MTSTQSGYYDFSELTHKEITAMGDAITVTKAVDSNGNEIATAATDSNGTVVGAIHGYRVPLREAGSVGAR